MLFRSDLENIKEDVLANTGNRLRFFVGEDATQKQKMFKALKVEYNTLLDKEKKFFATVKSQLEDLKKEIEVVKNNLKNSSSEFLSKKLGFLNKEYQVILDMREVKQQILETLKQHVDYLDKHFKSIKDAPKKEAKSLYSFSELQSLTHKIMTEQIGRAHV